MEQVPDDDQPCYVNDPYNVGYSMQLIDSMEEKKPELVSGEINQELVDKVIADLKENFEDENYTTLEYLLSFLPDHILRNT